MIIAVIAAACMHFCAQPETYPVWLQWTRQGMGVTSGPPPGIKEIKAAADILLEMAAGGL